MNATMLGAIGAGLLLAATTAAAQGIGHTWIMRGQVIQAGNGEAVLCIGKADGAAPGQTLQVVRAEMVSTPGAKGGVSFRRRDVGTVSVAAIIDDHFARAKVTKGDVKAHDIVELERQAAK